MKKILLYMMMLAAAISVLSCESEPTFVENNDGEVISISFVSGPLTTKATEAGTGNENQVKWIDYFFYPVGSEETVAAVYQNRLIPDTQAEDNTYHLTIDDATTVAAIFGGAASVKVFAVANYPGEHSAFGEAPTIQAIKAMEIGDTFTDKKTWASVLPTDDKNLYFVMRGEGVATKNASPIESGSDNYGATGTVNLERVAVKITIDLNLKNGVSSSDSDITWTWKPVTDVNNQARVYLTNGVKSALIGGEAETPVSLGYDYFYLGKFPTKDKYEGYKTYEAPIFYSYPVSWTAGDVKEPHLKLVLPWYAEDANGVQVKQKEFYYKIMLPVDAIPSNTTSDDSGSTTTPARYTLGSNIWYKLDVKIDVLGGTDLDEVELVSSYKILNWTADSEIASNISLGRFISLDIPKDKYDMYTELTEIHYVSSGKVVAKVDKIYQLNYSDETVTEDVYMENDVATTNQTLLSNKGITASDIDAWVEIVDDKLVIRHTLCNDITVTPIQRFDAAPYVYEVTLHLEAAGTDTQFDRPVTITQYPAMYITARTNTDYNDGGGNNNHLGYVWINSNHQDTESWNTVRGLEGNNKNPNMYLIKTSILKNSDYVIGDPRVADYTTWGHTFNQGSWTEETGTNHRLTYYYPTGTDDEYKNIVSPAFRVASSYGVCGNTLNAENARYRCASYQEDGYPAGRWRVPTKSEIEYIATLSGKGFIPTLFNVGSTYRSSSGSVYINSNGTVSESTNNGYVRCVYDEWYWGPDRLSNISTFTWGDRER